MIFMSLPLKASVEWEGFLDTYVAHDFNRPRNNQRLFTTQPERHNGPSINLAFAGLRFQEERWRGRIALQGGNSVEANTLAENSDLRYIQESFVGYKLGEETWIDGGIYLGHIGAESFISRDNWTYSRSLNLDYVPYYAAGIRVTHKKFQFHIMNGWQNMREDNKAKSVGLQYNHSKSFTYNNFFGDEEVVFFRPRFRGYHNFIFRSDNFIGAFDIGHQAQRENNGTDIWWAISGTARRVLSETQSMAMRLEHYQDPHQANVETLTPAGFRVSSASVNFDQKLPIKTVWRTELRGFYSHDEIFPEGNQGKNRLDGFLVTSLAISLP
jgi:hypothetical protein